MSKLTNETFETLQDGLDKLFEDAEMITDEDEQLKKVKQIKQAEEEIVAIGTF